MTCKFCGQPWEDERHEQQCQARWQFRQADGIGLIPVDQRVILDALLRERDMVVPA